MEAANGYVPGHQLEWAKLLAMADDIRSFINEHESELKAKPES